MPPAGLWIGWCLNMAGLGGLLLLVLAYALLGARARGASLEEPCGQHLRYRESTLDLGEASTSAVVVLGSACAMWLFVFYALRSMGARKGCCSKEAEGGCDPPPEARQSSCAETHEDSLALCALPSPAPACAQPPRCSSRTPVYTQAQRAYARMLACMEQDLEAFLREVRTRRCALGDLILEEPCPRGQSAAYADHLRISVYEAANYEACEERPQRRGRRVL